MNYTRVHLVVLRHLNLDIFRKIGVAMPSVTVEHKGKCPTSITASGGPSRWHGMHRTGRNLAIHTGRLSKNSASQRAI